MFVISSLKFDSVLTNMNLGQEDCLYLNVYTKSRISDQHLLPVLVHIHGGGFQMGSSNEQNMGPELLMQEDIVTTS